jgi:hypothetical protein
MEYEREYPYRPPWTGILVLASLFGSGTVFLGFTAANNKRGMIINGLIKLGPDNATVFLWILTAFGACVVASAAFLAYHRLKTPQRIALGPTALNVPVSRWSRAEKEIPYRTIKGFEVGSSDGRRFLRIYHSEGIYSISADLLPSASPYEDVCACLGVQIARANSPN